MKNYQRIGAIGDFIMALAFTVLDASGIQDAGRSRKSSFRPGWL